MRQRPIDLDDTAVYEKLDHDGMLDRLREFPAQCDRAWAMAMSFPLPDSLRDVDGVLVVGMGGSAIGGDLVCSLAETRSPVPVRVHRGYTLPAWVNGRTLVITSSYSGSTEETLACFEQSLARGAKNMVVSTGGRLAEVAGAAGIPAFTFDYRSPPRAALPFSFMAILCFLGRLGLLGHTRLDIDEMLAVLRSEGERLRETVPLSSNLAKQLAGAIYGRIVVVYGAEILTEVAHRWKTQVNENSKTWAFYEALPELNHNSVVGYEFPPAARDDVIVIVLDSPLLTPRVRTRSEATIELLKGRGIPVRTVCGRGEGHLAQMMSLVLLGDYVSYYLAMLNGASPGPVDAIDHLKAHLARSCGPS